MAKSKITDTQKRDFIVKLSELGTRTRAIKAVEGLTEWMVRGEEKRSVVFRKRIELAKEQARLWMGDKALTALADAADGLDKINKTQLTAALAIANAYEKGFAQKRIVEEKREVNVTVHTAIPRPKYRQPIIEAQIRELPGGKE